MKSRSSNGSAASPIVRSTGHIQPIKTLGVVSGYQLRIDGGGPGKTKFFAVQRLGGAAKALRAARSAVKTLDLAKPKPRGGSVTGRVSRRSTSGVAGIRFTWVIGSQMPVLRVVATWVDRRGTPHSTSFSVEHRGLEGALDLAILARTSAGAPPPDKDALLKKLRKIYRTGAQFS